MSAQHTPGPWVAENQGTRIVISSPRGLVATVYGVDAEAEANAALLAAAPALLAAACSAEAILARGKWLDTSTGPEAVALRRLRAALAKVEGRS